MKIMQNLLAAAAIVVVLLTSCDQPAAPSADADVLTYSVDCTDQNLLVDITYMAGDEDIIKLTDQSLPWTLSIDLPDDFTGDAYIKAAIPKDEVFVAFMSGNADSYAAKQLKDSTVDFETGGVEVGDKVYSSNIYVDYADVTSVDDANTLSLNSELFELGNEPYYIYREKTLTTQIILNGVTVDQDTATSEKILSTIVQSSIDR